MYRIVLSITFMLINFVSSSSLAQEFSFKPPSTTTKQSSSGNIPTRSGYMSPESFKNGVSSATQNRNAAVSGLAKEKLKSSPEYSDKSMPSAQKPPGNQNSTITPMSQTPTKPTTPTPPQETPAQPVAAPQPYTGFSNPSPSGETSPSKKSTDQNSSGGFGNIYQ